MNAKPIVKCSRMRGDEHFAPPSAQKEGDAGLDLTVSRYACIAPGQDAHLATNVAMAMPEGHFGLILPRSSTLWRKRLHVSPGVVDAGYRGEVMIVVRNLSPDRSVIVNVGERVAQLLVLPLWEGSVRIVDQLGSGSRGSAGFGSTGGYTDTDD